MPPQQNRARLEKAGAQRSTACVATPTPAASYQEDCLVLGESPQNDCRLPRTSTGKPPAPCCCPGQAASRHGQGGKLGLPVFPCAGLGKGRADREGTTASE